MSETACCAWPARFQRLADLRLSLSLSLLGCRKNRIGKLLADFRSKLAEQLSRQLKMFVGRETKSQTKFGVVFEQ